MVAAGSFADGGQYAGLIDAATLAKLEKLVIGAEDGIGAVRAMVMVTGATNPALLAYIAFNMTTIPCFAAVATAKGELPSKKRYHWTLVFWLLASYIVAAVVFTIGSWWWTAFIWAAALAGVLTLIYFRNKKFRANME